MDFQQKLVKKLHAVENSAYEDAAIYTVLLDLVQESDIEEVFMLLHSVASDLGKREEIESLFDKAKNWKWS